MSTLNFKKIKKIAQFFCRPPVKFLYIRMWKSESTQDIINDEKK